MGRDGEERGYRLHLSSPRDTEVRGQGQGENRALALPHGTPGLSASGGGTT